MSLQHAERGAVRLSALSPDHLEHRHDYQRSLIPSSARACAINTVSSEVCWSESNAETTNVATRSLGEETTALASGRRRWVQGVAMPGEWCRRSGWSLFQPLRPTTLWPTWLEPKWPVSASESACNAVQECFLGGLRATTPCAHLRRHAEASDKMETRLNDAEQPAG